MINLEEYLRVDGITPPLTAKMQRKSLLISTFTEQPLKYCGQNTGQIARFLKYRWKCDTLLDFEKDDCVLALVWDLHYPDWRR